MEITRVRVRKDFAPLSASCQIVVKTPASPTRQAYQSVAATYEPDRKITPCVILPQITLTADDGSLNSPYGNDKLSTDSQSFMWYEGDTPLSDIPEWEGLYNIRTDGSMRGAIEIKRNFMPQETAEIHFEGVIADERTGDNIKIISPSVTLSCVAAVAEDYAIAIGQETAIEYDPLIDPLALYLYRVSIGEIEYSDDDYNQAANDTKAFLLHIPLTFYKGNKAITDPKEEGNGMFYLASGPRFTSDYEDSADTVDKEDYDSEFVSLSWQEIVIDMRCVESGDYYIELGVYNDDGEEITLCQKCFSISRRYPKFRLRLNNQCDIPPTATQRYDKVLADNEGQIITHPELPIKIKWFTDTQYATEVEHNEGSHTLFQLEKTKIGSTHADDWIDTYVKAEQKPAHFRALGDSEIATLEDENGYPLIFN